MGHIVSGVALVRGAKYIQIIGRSLIEKVPINSWILFLKLLLRYFVGLHSILTKVWQIILLEKPTRTFNLGIRANDKFPSCSCFFHSSGLHTKAYIILMALLYFHSLFKCWGFFVLFAPLSLLLGLPAQVPALLQVFQSIQESSTVAVP